MARMTRTAAGGFAKWFRIAATSAVTAVAGVARLLRRGRIPLRVELQPGDVAPDFSLVGSDGRTYRLSAFRGKQAVVLAWFPKAFTGGCAIECSSIGSNRVRLAETGAAVFAVSVDSPETNRAFAAAVGTGVPILSDPDTSVARAYGVLGRTGLPSRWTFYIGSDGRILTIDKQVRVSSHGLDIVTTLDALPRRT